ncbi:MAG: M48 family metallopeptidase [Candidatus Omnitrophota bacterium]
MWELIEENKRKSWIIFISMGLCLVLLGFVIGAAWFPPDGGAGGVIIALFLWVFLAFVSYSAGDSIILYSSGAKKVSYDVHPQLFNIVEEMKIAASLPAMPNIYIIDDLAPNAFATGKTPENSSIAVTAGLLSRLNRDELQGVVAHEMSHIINRDVLYVTFAGVMLGSIVMLSEIFLRSLWYSRGSSRRYRSGSGSSGGQAQAIIMLVAVVFAVLSPILARIFYFALSRKREYLADASAVRLTRYPEGLASALEKISTGNIKLSSANKITAPMYIVNPLAAQSLTASSLFSTHPPIKERVQILRGISQGVNYVNYQKAFAQVKGKSAVIMPLSALKDSDNIMVREPSIEEQKAEGVKKERRDVGDLMRAVNKYAFLACVCGLKIKIPPDFNREKISCPRCGHEHAVPLANLKAAITAVSAAEGIKAKQDTIKTTDTDIAPQVYTRKSKGWESFSCSCGKLLQLSPSFMAKRISCGECGRKTEIKY